MARRESGGKGVADRLARVRADRRRKLETKHDPREPHALQASGYHAIETAAFCPIDDFLAEEVRWAELEAEANEPPCDPWGIWQASECGHENMAYRGDCLQYWVDDEENVWRSL